MIMMIFLTFNMAGRAHRRVTDLTGRGAAGGEDRYEEVLYLPHREREDGRAAIDSLQDISGTGQAGQHHHPVVQAAPFIQHHAVSSRNGVVGSKTHVSVPLVPLVPLRKPLSVCSG